MFQTKQYRETQKPITQFHISKQFRQPVLQRIQLVSLFGKFERLALKMVDGINPLSYLAQRAPKEQNKLQKQLKKSPRIQEKQALLQQHTPTASAATGSRKRSIRTAHKDWHSTTNPLAIPKSIRTTQHTSSATEIENMPPDENTITPLFGFDTIHEDPYPGTIKRPKPLQDIAHKSPATSNGFEYTEMDSLADQESEHRSLLATNPISQYQTRPVHSNYTQNSSDPAVPKFERLYSPITETTTLSLTQKLEAAFSLEKDTLIRRFGSSDVSITKKMVALYRENRGENQTLFLDAFIDILSKKALTHPNVFHLFFATPADTSDAKTIRTQLLENTTHPPLVPNPMEKTPRKQRASVHMTMTDAHLSALGALLEKAGTDPQAINTETKSVFVDIAHMLSGSPLSSFSKPNSGIQKLVRTLVISPTLCALLTDTATGNALSKKIQEYYDIQNAKITEIPISAISPFPYDTLTLAMALDGLGRTDHQTTRLCKKITYPEINTQFPDSQNEDELDTEAAHRIETYSKLVTPGFSGNSTIAKSTLQSVLEKTVAFYTQTQLDTVQSQITNAADLKKGQLALIAKFKATEETDAHPSAPKRRKTAQQLISFTEQFNMRYKTQAASRSAKVTAQPSIAQMNRLWQHLETSFQRTAKSPTWKYNVGLDTAFDEILTHMDTPMTTADFIDSLAATLAQTPQQTGPLAMYKNIADKAITRLKRRESGPPRLCAWAMSANIGLVLNVLQLFGKNPQKIAEIPDYRLQSPTRIPSRPERLAETQWDDNTIMDVSPSTYVPCTRDALSENHIEAERFYSLIEILSTPLTEDGYATISGYIPGYDLGSSELTKSGWEDFANAMGPAPDMVLFLESLWPTENDYETVLVSDMYAHLQENAELESRYKPLQYQLRKKLDTLYHDHLRIQVRRPQFAMG